MQTEKTKSKGNAKTKAKPERDMARVKAGQYSLYNLPLNEHSRIVFNWSVAMIE